MNAADCDECGVPHGYGECKSCRAQRSRVIDGWREERGSGLVPTPKGTPAPEPEIFLYRFWDAMTPGAPVMQRRRVIRISKGCFWFKRPRKGFYASSRNHGECWVQRYEDGRPGGGYHLTWTDAVGAYHTRGVIKT